MESADDSLLIRHTKDVLIRWRKKAILMFVELTQLLIWQDLYLDLQRWRRTNDGSIQHEGRNS